MGIVLNQSFKNTISTYLGFGIGAINTLFLFTNFLTDEYYGLVSYLLSTANIMSPLMAFGVSNTLVKFYPKYKEKHHLDSFLTMMLFLPLVVIVPVGLIGLLFNDSIGNWLASENTIARNYVWYIYVAGIAMAYFEVFYAWSKAHMQTVVGNFLKEVFLRFGTMLLLFAVYFKWLSVEDFLIGIIIVYIIRMILMKVYAFRLKWPQLKFLGLQDKVSILKYAAIILLAGSVATMILDIDKFMLGKLIPIEYVAFYSVAIYIATVIAVPQRAMHQVLLPLTATMLVERDKQGLQDLYVKSSLNLIVVGGLIFLLIVLNIKELYQLLPSSYSQGLWVVLIISAAKLYDNFLGNNNAILFNSDYYRMVLVFGVVLVIVTVILNTIFIPLYGITGSAIATFLAIFLYNTIKLIFVKHKLNLSLYSPKSLYTLVLIIFIGLGFYFWDFTFHPLLNITIKSILITLIYAFAILKFNISEEFQNLWYKLFRGE
ncbi:oligosaccharide flippase family protein [Aegicerativicinus sediminis]|uniref:oligosaccharide flippase family protein n=1 Tax=Aegicerativicinus sediminis TaxID=2893202 RepID=UPI001E6131EE|nr:lipopolysaccharide biosynthesis protein [Aegicerativicinus sediminis]